MSVQVQVHVGYECDPDKVEAILYEVVAQAVSDMDILLPQPPPAVMFDPGFGESAMGFTVSCQVAEFANQYPARHELRKRIFRRFREEGMRIPYPARQIYPPGAGEGGEQAVSRMRGAREDGKAL